MESINADENHQQRRDALVVLKNSKLFQPFSCANLFEVYLRHMADTEVSIPFVLVAEDNSDDGLLVRYAIKQSRLPNPYQIVSNGLEARIWLQLALEDPHSPLIPKPGVLLLDLNAPGSNPLQLLEWVHTHPAYHDLAIIVLGGVELSEDQGRNEAWPDRIYLLKRGDFSEAIRLVADLNLLQLV